MNGWWWKRPWNVAVRCLVRCRILHCYHCGNTGGGCDCGACGLVDGSIGAGWCMTYGGCPKCGRNSLPNLP